MPEAFICDAVRTPFGRYGGGLAAVRAEPRQFLNRLSDLLFVLARVLNRANLDGLGGDDVYWKSERLARDAGGADEAD